MNGISDQKLENLKEFTPGTKFVSLFGAPSIVADPFESHTKAGCVFVKCEGIDNISPFRLVYDGNWAEIKTCSQEDQSLINMARQSNDYDRIVNLGHKNF